MKRQVTNKAIEINVLNIRASGQLRFLGLCEAQGLDAGAGGAVVGSSVELLTDIRLSLAQEQPLGSERFAEKMCAAVGVRRAQKGRGGLWRRSIRVRELKIKPILDFEQAM